jgi:hypothetical protein
VKNLTVGDDLGDLGIDQRIMLITVYFPFTTYWVFYMTQTAYKTLHLAVLLLVCVYSCHGNVFTELLPSNDRLF